MACVNKNISREKDIKSVEFRGIQMRVPDTPANTPPDLATDVTVDTDLSFAVDPCLTEDEDAN